MTGGSGCSGSGVAVQAAKDIEHKRAKRPDLIGMGTGLLLHGIQLVVEIGDFPGLGFGSGISNSLSFRGISLVLGELRGLVVNDALHGTG